jgi:hypothetical protein
MCNSRDPFGLCPEYAGGDGKTSGSADCSRSQLDAWAAKHISIGQTDWSGVDATLRDAVIRGSIDLQADFYISAGREGGHADLSFHAAGLAVDISRVDNQRFAAMGAEQASSLGSAVSSAIFSHVPRSRWAEAFSPGGLQRFDKVRTYGEDMAAQHRSHVHLSITPPE